MTDPNEPSGERPTRDRRLMLSALLALALAVAATSIAGGGDDPSVVSPFVEGPLASSPLDPEDDAERAERTIESPDASTGEVAESRAVVKGGQIVLEGAVPDRASADAIIAIAAEVMGPDNVIDNYVIDPRADDPNLGNVRVDDQVLFASNSDVVAPEFEPLLLQAVALMTIRPNVTLTIEGHTDDVGDDAYNLDLSQRRAESVVTFIAGHGIDPSRMTPVGKGETTPRADNATPDGRRQNRRIQVYIENLLAE